MWLEGSEDGIVFKRIQNPIGFGSKRSAARDLRIVALDCAANGQHRDAENVLKTLSAQQRFLP